MTAVDYSNASPAERVLAAGSVLTCRGFHVCASLEQMPRELRP
jgi:hypothetical protein